MQNLEISTESCYLARDSTHAVTDADGKGVSLSFHGLLADSCSSKAKPVAGFTDKGLLPCGFTTWQLRDRGKSYLFIIWIIYEIPNVF